MPVTSRSTEVDPPLVIAVIEIVPAVSVSPATDSRSFVPLITVVPTPSESEAGGLAVLSGSGTNTGDLVVLNSTSNPPLALMLETLNPSVAENAPYTPPLTKFSEPAPFATETRPPPNDSDTFDSVTATSGTDGVVSEATVV